MFLRKKAQSTAEYAITIALVIAVTAGILQVALKGAIRQKNQQAMNYLLSAGESEAQFNTTTSRPARLFSQDIRETNIDKDSFRDETVLQKGGVEKKLQVQKSSAVAISVETMNATQ